MRETEDGGTEEERTGGRKDGEKAGDIKVWSETAGPGMGKRVEEKKGRK